MLQWMGGSRRKVNDSRRSKQKRQKQYFEQRKRQQHEQITSSPDNLVDGYNNTCSRNLKEKRSLDVLSMHSLAKVAEGCTSTGILKLDPLPENLKIRNLPKFINKIVTAANNVETLQTRSMSNTPEKRMIEEELRFSNPNLYSSTSTEGNPKGGELKHASGRTSSVKEFEDLSVFELVDEDGKGSKKSEEKTAYEAHVAFSMQGLGKAGNETPVKSPQSSRRILPDGQSCLFKAAKQQHLHRNFGNLLVDQEIDMESMIENGDMFSNDKYFTTEYSESWRFGSRDHPKHGFLEDSSTELYDENPQVESFDGKENTDDIQEFHTNFLEVNTGFPIGSSYNQNIDMPWEKGCFTDVSKISRTQEAEFTEDFSFDRSDLYGRTDRFDDLDFCNRYPTHQLPEGYDVLKSDDSNYFPGNKFLYSGAKQSRFSFLKADNPMDNFSSLSGESCSSSAVKGRKRSSIFDGAAPENPSITEEFLGTKFKPGQQGEYDSPRAYSRPVDFPDFGFDESFDHDGFHSKSIHIEGRAKYGSSHHRSNKDHSRECKPVGGEDIYGLFSSSSFHFDTCKDDSSVESACPMKNSAFVQDFASFPEYGCHNGFGTLAQSSGSTEVSGKQEHKDILTNQRSAHRTHDKNIKEKVRGLEGTVSGTPKPFPQTQDKFSKKTTDGFIGNIFQENDNDTSSFVALSDNSGSRASEKGCHNNNLDVQSQPLGPEKSNSEHNSIASDGEDSSIKPSYQVMMLESHMLRLLCVKKKRKSAQKEVVKSF